MVTYQVLGRKTILKKEIAEISHTLMTAARLSDFNSLMQISPCLQNVTFLINTTINYKVKQTEQSTKRFSSQKFYSIKKCTLHDLIGDRLIKIVAALRTKFQKI